MAPKGFLILLIMFFIEFEDSNGQCLSKLNFKYCKASKSNNPMWKLHNTHKNYFRLNIDKSCKKTTLSFYWQLREKPSNTWVMDFPNFTEKSVLAIENGILGFGQYTLTVTATDLRSGSSKRLECWINFVTRKPIPILLGGGMRTAHKGDTISLDASKSEESGVKNLKYRWKCSTSNGKYNSCNNLKSVRDKTASLKIEANPGKTYTITFTLSGHGFSESEKQEIKVVAASAPRLEIKCEKNCPAKGRYDVYVFEKLFLRAVCLKNCGGLQYQWSVDPAVEGVTMPAFHKLIMKTEPSKFKHDVEYKMTVKALKNNSEVATAMMPLMICGDPKRNGVCTSNPSEGTSLKTVFKISCSKFDYRRPVSYAIYQNDIFLTEDATPELEVRLAAPSRTLHIELGDDIMVRSNYNLSTLIKVNPLFSGLGTDAIIKQTLEIYNGETDYTDSVKNLGRMGRTEEAVQIVNCLLSELKSSKDKVLQKFARDFYVMVVKDLYEFSTEVAPYGLMSLLPHFRHKDPQLNFTIVYSKLCHKLAQVMDARVMESKIPLLLLEITDTETFHIILGITFFLSSDYYKIGGFETITQNSVGPQLVIEEEYLDYKNVLDDALRGQCMKITEISLEAIKLCAHAFSTTIAYGEDIVRAGNFVRIILQVDAAGQVQRKLTFRNKIIAILPKNLGFKRHENVKTLLISFDNKVFAWEEHGKNLSTRMISIYFFNEQEEEVVDIPERINCYLEVERKPEAEWNNGTVALPSDPKKWTNNDLTVHRIEISKGSNLIVEFQEIAPSKEIRVVIIKGRRPNLKDFNKARVTSNNKSIIMPSVKENTFYYVAVLHQKKEGTRRSQRSHNIEDLMDMNKESETNLTYQYKFLSQKCLEFYEGKWQILNCEIGPKTTLNTIHCICPKVTALSGLVDLVRFKNDDVLPISFRLQLQLQYVVYLTTIFVFAVYCIALCFAVFRNKTGKNHIYFLGDNVTDDRYGYFIIIKTGKYYSAGTTSNVVIKLHGTKCDSMPHVLNFPDPDKKVLQQSNTDWFLLAALQHLGDLTHIELWFDSIGQRPSWYCESIRIIDLQSEQTWFFVVQTWFCLLKGVDRVDLVPVDEDRLLEKHGVLKYFRFYLGREHTWNIINSVDDKKLRYVERLTIVLSHILCTYTFVLLFCITPEMRLRDGLTPAFFDSYSSIIGVAFGISIVSFLVNIPFVFVFRNSERKSQTNVETKKKLLPPKAIYYSWIILIGIVTTTIVYLVVFGFWISLKASWIWLIISTLAILFSIFVLESVYLSIYLVVNRFLLKGTKRSVIYKFVAIVEESERQRRMLNDKFGRFALRPYLLHLYKPLTRVEFLRKRSKLMLRNAIARSFRDMLTLIIFMTFLFILLLAHMDYTSALSGEHMDDMVVKAKFGGTFPMKRVQTTKDIYTYINETLFPTIHSYNWYGEWNATDPGLMSDFNTKVLGVARIRQWRVVAKDCKITDFMESLNITACNQELSWSNLDSESIGAQGSIWYYAPSREAGFLVTFGEMKTYYGGGYISLLSRTISNAYYKLQFLLDSVWIDVRTRALFIEFWTYNANTNLFNTVKLIFEQSATQLILKNRQIFTERLTQGDLAFELFTTIVFTIFVIIVAYLVVKCAKRIVKYRTAYFISKWNVMDLLITLTSVLVIAMFFARSMLVSNLLRVLDTTKNNEFVNYFMVISFVETLKIIIAILICAVILRLWRFLRFLLMFRILERTVVTAAPSLCAVFFYNLLIFSMFAISGYIAFGAFSNDFHNIPITFTNLMLLGLNINRHFDYEVLSDYNPRLGTVYYVMFMFAMLIVLSIYITVIIIHYESSQNYFSNKSLNYSIKDYISDEWNYIYQLLKRRIKNVRLRGGQDIPPTSYFKVYPKSDEKRYANSLKVSEGKMEQMTKIARGVLYNLYGREEQSEITERKLRIMRDITLVLIGKEINAKKNVRFFTTKIENEKVKLIPDEKLVKMEVFLKGLLSPGQQWTTTDKTTVDRIKNIENFVIKANVIIGNINIVTENIKYNSM